MCLYLLTTRFPFEAKGLGEHPDRSELAALLIPTLKSLGNVLIRAARRRAFLSDLQ